MGIDTLKFNINTMNRRDLILIAILLIVFAFDYFILPTLATATAIMGYFTISLALIVLLWVIVLVLSAIFEGFGTWGDKKIFGKD